jgi:hypothetical protein
MKNSDKKETLSWLLLAISPITFGLLIVAAISILIAKHYGLNLNEDGIIVLPIYFTYTFLWARIYRKVTGLFWLN